MTVRYASPYGVVEFSGPVLKVFDVHRQNGDDAREAGGQLFAKLEPSRVLLLKATRPNRHDIRSRYSFLPNRKREQRDINASFRAGLHYIGDWHTHPEDCPVASGPDIHKIQAVFRESRHSLAAMLLVVIGRASGADGIWCALIGERKVRVLSPIRDESSLQPMLST